MPQIKIDMSAGWRTRFAGKPDDSLIRLPEPETVALSAMDIPYIKPKLLVKEGEPVLAGTPLFHDKRNEKTVYVSPGSGRVKTIVFGPRRRLVEVVVALDGKEASVGFDPIDPASIPDIPRQDLITRLQQGGLWPGFRQFPFSDTADGSLTPPMVIVSLNGPEPFSPRPHLVLKDEFDFFKTGLNLLRRFTDQVVVTVRHSDLDRLGPARDLITHSLPDAYPCQDPKVVLYHLRTEARQNSAWTIRAEHLILAAKFLLTGTYPVKRVVTMIKPHDTRPHIITRQGVPIAHLAGRPSEESRITTGLFRGRMPDAGTHLGFFESSLWRIPRTPDEEFFGFVRPGFDRHTLSRTFGSSLTGGIRIPDQGLHGEERACINCGHCERVCPVDLKPAFIMKAILADDVEQALSLGLLDCCLCGLCTFACPSKVELSDIFSSEIQTCLKDKE